MPNLRITVKQPMTRSEFRQFVRGYLQALGFTGHRWVENGGEGDGDPVFPGSGQFDDNWDVREELAGKLSVGELRTIISDCKGFLSDVRRKGRKLWEEVCGELEQAGTDFHFTRNGHGAGFWDGDLESGDKLTEISKTYGTAELSLYVSGDGTESYSIDG
jgi:hypothetical protein